MKRERERRTRRRTKEVRGDDDVGGGRVRERVRIASFIFPGELARFLLSGSGARWGLAGFLVKKREDVWGAGIRWS